MVFIHTEVPSSQRRHRCSGRSALTLALGGSVISTACFRSLVQVPECMRSSSTWLLPADVETSKSSPVSLRARGERNVNRAQ